MFKNRSTASHFMRVAAIFSMIAVCVFCFGCSEQSTADQAAANGSTTTTVEPYLDTGVHLPVDAKFTLVNDPEALGDVAELELLITSHLDDVTINAELVFPTEVAHAGGQASWSGKLSKDESTTIPVQVKVDTNEPRSVQAKITYVSNGNEFTRGAAYHIDLGATDVGTTTKITVDGYEGATQLNVRKPGTQEENE